ncbi:MAG TPA: hypothetical protein VHC49_14730 [Mycobacteriales bacterium]|nr:hypothetical protein [Mycobacteriales bacterium]
MSFLDSMPAPVARQRDLLGRLLAVMEPDPRWRWLELGCSLARGAGDEFSDVDCGAGATDWPGILDGIEDLVNRLGSSVDILRQSMGAQHTHVFVQYSDGLQLSLVVSPADSRPGLPPGSVALLDRDGRLARPFTPSAFAGTAEELREWTFLGWIALSDLVKYLRRGSVWEAHARLAEVRDLIFRLWAAERGLDYPRFGLTSVLDAPDAALPPRIEETVAGLEPDGLLRAGRRAAVLLREIGVPLEMGDYVENLL